MGSSTGASSSTGTGASSSTGAGSSTVFSTAATLSPPAQDCKTSSTLLPDASALASADRCTNDSGAFNISATLLKSSLILEAPLRSVPLFQLL